MSLFRGKDEIQNYDREVYQPSGIAYVYNRSSAGLSQSQNFVPYQSGQISASQQYSSPVNLSTPAVAQGANFTRVNYSPERYSLQSGGAGVSIKYQSIPNTHYASGNIQQQQQNVYASENVLIPVKVHQEEILTRVEPITVQNAYIERVVQPVQTVQAVSVPVIVKPPVQFISRYEKKEEVKRSGEDCSQYKLRILDLEQELSITQERVN